MCEDFFLDIVLSNVWQIIQEYLRIREHLQQSHLTLLVIISRFQTFKQQKMQNTKPKAIDVLL